MEDKEGFCEVCGRVHKNPHKKMMLGIFMDASELESMLALNTKIDCINQALAMESSGIPNQNIKMFIEAAAEVKTDYITQQRALWITVGKRLSIDTVTNNIGVELGTGEHYRVVSEERNQ